MVLPSGGVSVACAGWTERGVCGPNFRTQVRPRLECLSLEPRGPLPSRVAVTALFGSPTSVSVDGLGKVV